jgi:hypothetical protein
LPELVAPLTCHQHPDRPAMALCVACGKRICPACATPWEGRQYCVSCLAARSTATGGDRTAWGWAALALAGCALLWLVTWLRPLWAGLLAGLQ